MSEDSENFKSFAFRTIIIGAAITFVLKSIMVALEPDTSIRTNNESDYQEQVFESDYYEGGNENYSTGIDARVPICPAKPNGAKVLPGAGYLAGSNEHSNCRDYCLVDREKELEIQLEAQRREQRIRYLENQLNQ